MAGVLAAIDSEFIVRCTRLPRITPFPTWNGVLSCSRYGLVSVLSECGRVYLLRLTASSTFEFEDSLSVVQVLESDADSVMSMCQAWTCNGELLVVARDRHLTIYRHTDTTDDPEPFKAVSTVWLRFAATTLVVGDQQSGGMLLVVGCVAGVMVYSSHCDGAEVALISTFMDEVAVAVVEFSPDIQYLAIGTTDGRVMILRRTLQAFSETLTKVLAAPRVTSLTFSPVGDKLIATTRKGNVYVFMHESHQWKQDASFEALIANPKGGATSQTLSCWWGAQATRPPSIFTLAGRSSSCSVEMYDVHSRSLLHTLKLSAQRPEQSASRLPESTDCHIMGIVSVSASAAAESRRLVVIDSDATVSIINWPFLANACPQ